MARFLQDRRNKFGMWPSRSAENEGLPAVPYIHLVEFRQFEIVIDHFSGKLDMTTLVGLLTTARAHFWTQEVTVLGQNCRFQVTSDRSNRCSMALSGYQNGEPPRGAVLVSNLRIIFTHSKLSVRWAGGASELTLR